MNLKPSLSFLSGLLSPALLACLSTVSILAQTSLSWKVSEPLQKTLDEAIAATITNFTEQKLAVDELAATVIDLRKTGQPLAASHRGGARIYPASVIKLFYLEAAHRWMEQGKIKDTPELRRAMSDMMVHSYNEATHYILDLLTETTSGPELPAEEMAAWSHKRNAVNRYFAERGYENINANQKPWCEGPYGRDRIFVGEKYTNRNMLTTDATARLMLEIATGQAVTPERSRQMFELMRRDLTKKDADDQGRFTGPALPPGSKLWSKAGWTSSTRHDAAYIELPGGEKLILVIFTVNHANQREIIHTLARRIVERF